MLSPKTLDNVLGGAPLGPGEARVRNGHVGASGIGCGVAAADPSTLASARLALACWLSSMLLFFFRWSMSWKGRELG